MKNTKGGFNMAKNKYYAVKRGRIPGIYDSWEDAKYQVNEFSGAVYKGFENMNDAEVFMSYRKVSNDSKERVSAFVDGSFDREAKRYGSGVVLVRNGEIVEELTYSGNEAEFVMSYQVPGEVFAVIKAIEWAKDREYRELDIFYDYEGIEKWALGVWKANKPISQYYINRLNELMRGSFQISFQKVRAHSGNKHNERADELAKEAIKNHLEKAKTAEDLKEDGLLNKVLSDKLSGKLYEAKVSDEDVKDIKITSLGKNKLEVLVNLMGSKYILVKIE